MASSSLRFRLHTFSCTGDHNSIGVFIPSFSNKSIAISTTGFGIHRSHRLECTFRQETSASQKNGRWGFIIRSELSPSHESDGGDVEVTVSREGASDVVHKDVRISEPNHHPDLDCQNGVSDSSGGHGGDGKFPPSGDGGSGGCGGSGDGDGEDKTDEDEFGPVLMFEEVIREAESRGVSLPSDMLEAAKTSGIPEVILSRYLDLQSSAWPLGFAIKSCSMLRNRMLADPSFLFKVGAEIVIDSCCATFAEVQKRGKDFWAEFELYAADLLVGVVVNIALVGLLAPYARIGRPSTSKSFIGRMKQAYGALPSSVFEAERPGCKFSVEQRIGTYFYKLDALLCRMAAPSGRTNTASKDKKLHQMIADAAFRAKRNGLVYGSVGFVCGLVGQGIANLIMTAKRSVKKSEEDIPVPPLVKSAALWGVFLAISSNSRYQIINGLERVVEGSPIAQRAPPIAMAFTVGVRFANNIYGGMQFVDWARWSGVQ